jgi:drug/metabolite transporter (DMT)-like permease
MPPRLGAFLAVVFWGLSFVATKAALRELSPITLITTRFALGVALLLVLLQLRRVPVLPPRELWGTLALMGFVGVFVHQMLQSFALTMTGAISTGWLIGLTPLWSAVLSAWLLRERFPPAKVAGLALGFAGAALVVTRGQLGAARLALPATKGDLLILVSTLNWAVYSVLGHPVLKRLGATRATAGALLFGWLMLLPLFLGRGLGGGALPGDRLLGPGLSLLVRCARKGPGHCRFGASLPRAPGDARRRRRAARRTGPPDHDGGRPAGAGGRLPRRARRLLSYQPTAWPAFCSSSHFFSGPK